MTAGATKKVGVSEEDVHLLLQRYNPTTILTLLQEVSQVAGVRMDWNALVRRTATGITNAREYQMLWRHLAYHDTLLEKIEDGTEPLDDESDLELEIEAVPAASGEALSEAAACVKVMTSCGLPRESGLTNRTSLESPLAVNGSNDQMLRVPLDKQFSRGNRGTNITVPSLQRQPLPTGTSAEGLDGNGSAGSSFPPKKKRKLWTKEEDMELIAAVQKFGEGNWANILKGDFKHNRTASQLSQRWAIIRKRGDANVVAGSGNKSASSTRSEERLATQKAISLALDMPKSGRLSAILSGGTQSISAASSAAVSVAQSEALPVSTQPLNQLQQPSNLATSRKITLNTLNKSQTTPKKSMVLVKPSTGPNSLIQAAAFAAGGRIATPSTAASLFKAARSKNAVHIRPGGGARPSPNNSIKPLAVTNTTGLQPTSVCVSRPAVVIAAPPLANPVSLSSSARHGGQQVESCSVRVANNPLSTASRTQQVILESNSDTVSHEMAERKSDVDISAIDVDELLAEEVKSMDDMEFNDVMAHKHQIGLLSLDIDASEDGNFNNAYDAQVTVDKQMELPKSMANQDKNVDNKIVSSDTEAAENKAMEVDDNGHRDSVMEETALINGDSSKISPVSNLNNQNHIINQEQITSAEVMADEAEKSCTDAEQQALPGDTPSAINISTNDENCELVS